jgi:hypothetical protein
VVVGGYKAWTRWNNDYWSNSPDPWAFTLCSFVVILLFFILLGVSYFVVDGVWTPDSVNGVLRDPSPILRGKGQRQPKLERLKNEVLDFL